MKTFFAAVIVAMTILGTTAHAKDPKPTCSASAKNGWHNLGIEISDPISLNDCIAKTQALLNSPINDNQLAMNPFTKNATVKYFKVTFATAKMKYNSIDGKSKQSFTNENAAIVQTNQVVVNLGKDFFKCWKNGGDCAPLQGL